jgi:LysM repeat protein
MIHRIVSYRKLALTAFALSVAPLTILAQNPTSTSVAVSAVPTANIQPINPPTEMVIELEHKVKKGETLYGIAKHYHSSVAEIQSLNPGIGMLQPGMKVKVKQRTKVPAKSAPVATPQLNPIAARNKEVAIASLPEVPENVTDHVVTKGQSLYSISKQYGVSIAEIKKVNNLSSDQLSINQKLWIPNKSAIANTTTVTAANSIPSTAAPQTGNPKDSGASVVGSATEIPANSGAVASSNQGVSIKDSMDNQGGMPEQVATKLKSSNLKEYERKVIAQIGYEGMKADRSWVMMNKHKKGEVVAIINPVNKKMVYCTVIGELPDKGPKYIAVSQSVADRLGITEANATLRVRYVAQ